jgi:asparagine N-glycosylation enzyme membrane subunit Stt3
LSKKDSSDDMQIDFSKITNFFSNKTIFNKYALIIFLLVVSVFFSVFFRVYSTDLPITEQWAENAAYSSIRNSISNQVNQQYPNLPTQSKNDLIDEQFNEAIKSAGPQLEQQIKATSDHFRSRLQNDDGQTYLLAIDPYHFLRRIDNFVQTGNYYDELKNGNPWDTHMFAPIGTSINPDFHIYFSYYFHKFLTIFNPQLPLMTSFFYVPVVISALAVIPAFFIARRRAGNLGGFVAGLIVAIHPVFLGRTPAGFSDTDAYVVLFPLLATWLFMESFEAKKLWSKISLSIGTGFFIGLFAFAWSGWWYAFYLLLGTGLAFIGFQILRMIYNSLKDKKNILKSFSKESSMFGKEAMIIALFVISSLAFVFLIQGTTPDQIIQAPFSRIGLDDAAHANFWPNIQTTVAELNSVSIPNAISQLGGKFLFFIAMIGLILSLVKNDNLSKKDYYFLGAAGVFALLLLSNGLLNLSPLTYLILLAVPLIVGAILVILENKKVDIKYALLFTLWFAGSLFATTKGTRFTLLLVPAFALAVGIAIGLVHRLTMSFVNLKKKYLNKIVNLGLAVVLLLILFNPLVSSSLMSKAHSTAMNEVPSMNDAWWDTLTEIKTNSSEDAIINSWWDFGHWFKYVADRPVTVDGAGQDYQLAHWMGTVLLTDDEDKAVNTLRMLDCGSKQTYETLMKETSDVLLSVGLTKEIIMQDKSAAKNILLDAGITEETTEKTLNYAFCNPPENFLITSEDMVSKAGVWAHFGAWDFERSFIYRTSRTNPASKAIPIISEKLSISEDEASKYFYEVQALTSEEAGNAWIAPWPGYLTTSWSSCQRVNPESDPSLNGTNLLACGVNRVVSNNGNQRTVIEMAIVDLDNYKNTYLGIGQFDSQGRRVGSNQIIPASVVVYKENDFERISLENSGFGYDVVFDSVENRILLTDPLLSESLFTKLFYLDGRYNEKFEKFSERTSVTGQKISVWKVKW